MGTGSRIAVWAFISVAVLGSVMAFHGESLGLTLPDGWTSDRSGDYDRYFYNSKSRLAWNWKFGAWYHTSSFSTTYSRISASGLPMDASTSEPLTFIGDGKWRSLGNGIQYDYLAGSDVGFFLKGTTLVPTAQRLKYSYSAGQWWHHGYYGGWSLLGKAGVAAGVGLSAYYGAANVDIEHGMTFKYDPAADLGTFSKIVGTTLFDRFRYYYFLGRWQHKGNYGDWSRLGINQLKAENMADIALTDTGASMGFAYNALYDLGVFVLQKTTNLTRLRYSYADGVWSHKGYGNIWSTIAFKTTNHLGTSVGRIQFMLPDSRASLMNELVFEYNPLSDEATYYTQGTGGVWLTRFTYDYFKGIWNYWPSSSGKIQLNTTGLGSHLLDGNRNTLVNGWYFHYGPQYEGDPMSAIWGKGGTEDWDRFAHQNAYEEWWTRGKYTSGGDAFWQRLLGSKDWLFPGDGVPKPMKSGTPWWVFLYNPNIDIAYYKIDTDWRFRYEYQTGAWAHQHNRFGWQTLGTGLGSYFVGTDKLPTAIKTDRISIGNGWWYAFERMSATHQHGYFYTSDSDSALRFVFSYYYDVSTSPYLWEHVAKNGVPYGIFNDHQRDLFAYTLPAAFDGFSTPTRFALYYDPGERDWLFWKYSYNKLTDQGFWELYDPYVHEPFYAYDYSTGVWSHGTQTTYIPRVIRTLGASNCGFIGDFLYHDIIATPVTYEYRLGNHWRDGLRGEWRVKATLSLLATYVYHNGTLWIDGSAETYQQLPPTIQ